jgi:hypothetical protein
MPKSLEARVKGGVYRSDFSQETAPRSRQPGPMLNDYVVEIDAKGHKVWEWHANEHLDPNIDIMGPFYQREEWLHTNSVGALANGNIIITSRNTDSMLVIDKKSGQIIFRWGNTAHLDKQSGQLRYRSGASTLGGPHSSYAIPVGLPGAGHLLCYDNGLYVNASRWVEVDAASGKLIGHSSQAMGRKHFSDVMGNVERLPNGNTVVCDAANGRLLQMTPDSKIVWEYVSPHMPAPGTRGAIFKSHFYAPEYCPQFKGLPPFTGVAGVLATPVNGSAIDYTVRPARPIDRIVRGNKIKVILPLVVIVLLAFCLGRWIGIRR